MNIIYKHLGTGAPALILPVLLVLVVAGVATGICDAVVAGLILAGLTTFGEAIAYTMLARQSETATHARPYWFISGATWTTAFLLLLLLLATFGVWQPFPAAVSTDHGLAPRQMERIELIDRIASGWRASAAGVDHKDKGKLPTPRPADRDQMQYEPAPSVRNAPFG